MDDKKLLYDFLKGKKIINFSEQEFYNYISDRRKSDHLFSYLKENGNIDQEETADSFFSKYGGGTAPQKKNLGDTGQGVSPLSSGDERTAPVSDVGVPDRLERPAPRTFAGREVPAPVAPGMEARELARQDIAAMQQQRAAQFPLSRPSQDVTEFGVKTANKAISEVNEAREARQKDEERKRPAPPAAPRKPIFSPSGDIIGFTGGEKGVEMLSYGKFEGGADITEAVRAGAKETKGLLTKLPGTLENMAIDISTDMALAFFPKEQREAAKRYLPQIKEAQKEALRKVPGNVLGKAVQQIENYGADAWAERQLKEAEEIRSRFDNADASIQQLVSERKYGEATQKAVFEGMSSVPGMLLAALPGGIYALGATSAVAKYRQLEEEFGKGQLGATEVFNAAATGAAEALTEKVTGRIMRNAGTAIGLGTDYVEGVLGKAVGKVFGRVGGEIAEESLSEVAAQVSENIIDKITVDPDRNIFSGWFDAAVVGGLMGGAVSGGGALIGGAGRQVKRHITEATASKVLSPALQNISNVITQAHSVIYTPEETTQATATEAVDAYIERLPNFLSRELGITEEEAKNSPQYQNAVNNRERLINDVIERNKAGQVTSPPETLAAIEEEKRLGISRMPSGGAVATAESERTFSDVTIEMANQIALPENATAADIETAVDEYLAGIQQADPDAFADQLTYRNEVIDYLTQQSQANATQEVQNVQPESRVGQPVGAQEVQDQAATETGIGDRAISGGVQPEAQVVAPEKISKTIETTTISKGKNKGQSRTVEQNNYIEKTEDTDVSVTEYEVNIGDRKVTVGGLEMTVGDFKQEFPLLYESEQSLIDSLDENSKIKIRKVKRTPSDSRFNSVVSIYHPFIGTADLSISKDDNKYNAEINEIRGAQVATPPQEAVAPTAPTATPPTEITTPPAEEGQAPPQAPPFDIEAIKADIDKRVVFTVLDGGFRVHDNTNRKNKNENAGWDGEVRRNEPGYPVMDYLEKTFQEFYTFRKTVNGEEYYYVGINSGARRYDLRNGSMFVSVKDDGNLPPNIKTLLELKLIEQLETQAKQRPEIFVPLPQKLIDEVNARNEAEISSLRNQAAAAQAPTTPAAEPTTAPAETAPATPAPAAATKPALEIVESPDGTVGLQPNGTTVRSVDKPSAKEARKKALVSMAQRIKPLLNKIGVDIFFIDANSASDLALVYPEAAVTAMTTQRGTYLNTVAPVRPSILINTDFADVDTILHEAFHAAINAAFRTQPKELIGMMNAIKKLSILDKTKMSRELPDGTVEESTVAEQVERFVELYEADPEFIQAEEFLAELSSYIGRGFAEVKDTSLIARLERIVNTFLRRILGPNAPQVNWKTGNDVADFFNNLSRSLALGDIQMLAKAWRQFETKVRPQILGASGTPTTITTSTGDVQVRQQKGIINLTEQEVLAFSNIGITDKYMQFAAKELGMKRAGMKKEAIEAAVQKAFDDLIANANSFVISQPSKQIEIEMLREAETARRDGQPAAVVERMIEGAKDPQSNLYQEYFRKNIKTQTRDLSDWTGYLSQSDYPVPFKYIILKSVLKNNYDALTNQFKPRDSKTVRSFTPFDAGSLATLFVSESDSLLKDYVEIHAANAVNVVDHHSFLKGSEGEWIKFNGGNNTPEAERVENASKLSQLVQRTPWCTKELAKSQLDDGDFYVYVTDTEDGYKQPRIAIRMDGNSIAEVRGVLNRQELEPEMNQVAEDFIINDLPGTGGREWLDTLAYNKRAIALLERIKSANEITEEDMDEYFVIHAEEDKYSKSYGRNGNAEALEEIIFGVDGYVEKGLFKGHKMVYTGINLKYIIDSNGEAKYLYGTYSEANSGEIFYDTYISINAEKVTAYNRARDGEENIYGINPFGIKYVFGRNLNFLNITTDNSNTEIALKGVNADNVSISGPASRLTNLEYVSNRIINRDDTPAEYELPKLRHIGTLSTSQIAIEKLPNLESIVSLNINSPNVKLPSKLKNAGSVNMSFGVVSDNMNVDLSNIERVDKLDIKFFRGGENDSINFGALKTVGEITIYDVEDLNISSISKADRVSISRSTIISLGDLKIVKSELNLKWDSEIKTLSKLERVGKLDIVAGSSIGNADSLKRVDGDLTIGGDVKSLDGLEYAGQIDMKDAPVKSMKNLKRAKSIEARGSEIENLQSLERVDGYLELSRANISNLDSLIHAGGLFLYETKNIKSLPKLETVEENLVVRKSNVSDLPKLKSVGLINVHESNVNKLDSLEKVNKASAGGMAVAPSSTIFVNSLDAIIDSNVEISSEKIGLPNDEYVKTEDFYAMRDAHRAKKAREQAEKKGMSPEEAQAARDLLSTTMENYKRAIAARTEQMPKRKNTGFDIRQQRVAQVPAERDLKTFTPEFDESALHRDAVDGVKKFRDKTFAGIKEIGDSVVSSAMRTDELSAKLPADKRATVFSTGAGLPVKEMIRTITDSSPYSAYRIITSAKERINQILEGTLTEDRFLAGVLPMIIGDGKVSLSDYTMSVPSIDNVFIEVDGNYNNQVSSYGAVSMMMNTAAGKELMDAIKSGRQITEESEGAKFILPFAKNLQAIVERIKSALKRFSEYKSAKTPKERMAAIEKMSPVNDVSLAASIAGFGMQKKGSPIARAISGEVQKTGRLSFEPRLQRRAEVLAMATNTDQSLVEAVFADAWSKMPKDENLLDAISYDMLMSEFSYEAEVDMLSLPDNPDSFDIREQRVKRHIRDNPEYKAMRKYVKDNNGKITDRDMLVYLTENFTIGQTDAKDLISGVTGRAFSHSRNVHVDNASKFLRTLSRLFGGNNDQTTREFAYSVGFNMTNYLISIKQFQENVEKATGALMPKAKNAYDAMRLYMSASMQELQPFIEWFHGDKGSIESTKNSFVGRLSKALGGVGNFNDFLLVLHMPERLERKMDLQNQYIMDLIDDINSRFGPIPAGMAATSTTIGGYSYAVHPDAATSKDLQVILLNKKLDAALKKQQGFLDSYAKAMTKREIFVDRIAGPGAYSAAGGNLGNVAKLDKFFEFYNEFRKEMIVPYLNDMLAAGRIDRVRYDHLLNGTSDESSVVWKTYVPFIYSEDAFDQEHGLHDSEISVGAKGIRGISKPEAPNIRAKIMKFFGKGNSSVEVDDMDIIKPLEIAFHRRMLAVKEKHRMEAMRSLAALLKQHANPDEVRVFGSMRVPKKSKYGNFVGSTNYMPKEIMEQSLTYYEDGKMMMIYFADPNDMIFQAMKYQDPENALGPIASIMRTLGAMVKVSITSLSPKFIIRNMLRDPQEALVNLAVETESLDIDQGELYLNYAKRLGQSFGYNFAGALFKTTGFYSELDTYLREYLQAGGAMSWNFTSAEIMAALKEEAEKNIDRAERVGYKNSILDGGAAKVNKLIETLYWFSNAAENQSRLAAYAALRDMGVESNRAAAIAKNVTINFEAKGQQFRQGKRFAWMRDYSLFIGPSLASFGKIFKTLGSPVGRKVLGLHYLGSAALRVLLLGGSAALLGGEGEDEEKQIEEGKVPLSDRLRNYMYSSWIRANYTLILNPFDKDDPLMIPRSYGAGRLVSVMAEGTVDVAAGVRSVSNVSGDILTAVLTTFNPITGASTQFSAFAPWILQPIAETAQNKDYAGRVIRFPQDQNRAYAVGNKSTPQAYYDVARGAYNTLGINIYPDSYRHWFESYVKWLPPAKPVLSIADAVRDYKRDEKAVKSTNEQTWQEYLWEQGKLDFIVYRPNLSQSDKQHLFNFMEITEIKGKAPIVSKRWNMNEIEYMIDALRVIRTKIPTIKETILVGQIQAVAEEMASTGQYDEKIGGDGKFKDLTYGALITRLIKEESGRRIRVEIAKERLRKQGLLPPEER